MRIVCPGGLANFWHADLMRSFPNCYEWWYADTVSRDGDWTLVVIFLLGNPFSSYYRLCSTAAVPDPVTHNGLFFALHHRQKLHHYLFARYPKERLTLSQKPPLDLRFGPNRCFIDSQGALRILTAEENGNRRSIRAELTFTPSQSAACAGSPTSSISGLSGDRDYWEPVMAGADTQVNIEISSPGFNRSPERISFAGSGYHDHNWGRLPFETSLADWTWARADFGSEGTAIIYSVRKTDGSRQTSLVLSRPGHRQIVVECGMSIRHTHCSRFGTCYPAAFAAISGDIRVEWRFQHHLENVPFYVRYRADAILTLDGRTVPGHGTGEYFRPLGMGTALIASAMERRIYDPVTKT